MHVVQHGNEGCVEAKHVVVIVHKLVDERVVGVDIGTNARVVSQGPGYVEVGLVLFVEHGVGNVWHISSGIRFSRHIDLKVLDAKQFLKVLEETDKVGCNVLLTSCRDVANGEACAHRLLNPEHIGQVDPAVQIELRRVLTPCPLDVAIFLKEPFQ